MKAAGATNRKPKFWQEEGLPTRAPRAIGGEVRTLDDLPKLYDVNDAAEYFGVCTWTIYTWKSEGLIVPTMQGRSVRFTAQQIADCKARREARANG